MSSSANGSSSVLHLPRAAERYQVTPCIVVGVGDRICAGFEELRASVEFWVAESFPPAGVTWGYAASADLLARDHAWAEYLLNPLLDLNLWFFLRDHSYVDQLPSDGSLRPIRVCMLYELSNGGTASDLLTNVCDRLKLAALDRAVLHFSLILIIPHGVLPGSLPTHLFHDVYVIESVGRGGLGAPTQVQHAVTRILLHALVASQATDIIADATTQVVGQRYPRVLGVGAAAISTAITHMRRYRTARLEQALFQPFVGDLTSTDQERYHGLGREEGSHSDVFGNLSSKILDNHGWPAGSDKPRLSSNNPLWIPIAHMSDDYVPSLTEHLYQLDLAFRQEFEDARKRETKSLLARAYDILNKPDASPPDPRQQASDLYSDKDFSYDERQGRLAHVGVWLEGLIDGLNRHHHSHLAIADPIYAANIDGWRNYARAEWARAQEHAIQLRRLQTATATPAQALWRVLPAWPLLAFLTFTVSSVASWIVWLGAFAVVVGFVLVVSLLWRHHLRRIAVRLHQQRLDSVRQLVLGLARYHVNREREIMLDMLGQILRELRVLTEALSRHVEQADADIHQVMQLGRLRTAEGAPNEYLLYDLPLCDRWVKQMLDHRVPARRQGEQTAHEIAPVISVRAYVENVVKDVIEGRLIGIFASEGVERELIRLGKCELDTRQLAAVELCDRDPVLNEAKCWTWLRERAHPMAGSGLTGHERTIVALGDPSDLDGAYGRSNSRWGDDWLEARSRHPHRIICIRVFLLADDYLVGRSRNSSATATP